MSDTFGNVLKLTTFGESHLFVEGAVLSGLESNFTISFDEIKKDLERRRGGKPGTTQRAEEDKFEIVSGIFEGKTTGTSLAILIENKDIKDEDYESLKDVFRPGHADETYMKKYLIRDYRGGGRASGRETVSRVAAGSICKQILKKHGISINAQIVSIGGKTENWDSIIEQARENDDSVGGKIRCTVSGLEAGIGEPVFDKLDAVISHAVMSVGAIKGIEFGSGFGCEILSGKENNKAENAGGILGGISDGNDIVFDVAVKPTPSVGLGKRHDTCIALRMAPVIEAMTAVALLDMYYIRHGNGVFTNNSN